MPVPRTRSNSKSSAPQPDAPASAPSLATPADVATSGYPGKPAEKGKAVPKGLHFKSGTGNTYTGSSVPKGKQRVPAPSASPASSTVSSNAFGPLAVFQEGQSEDEDEQTLEEQLARELVGADELNALYDPSPTPDLHPPSPPPESASGFEGTSNAAPAKTPDAMKAIARKLAGRPATIAPVQNSTSSGNISSGPSLPWSAAVVAAAASPFLTPIAGHTAPINGGATSSTASQPTMTTVAPTIATPAASAATIGGVTHNAAIPPLTPAVAPTTLAPFDGVPTSVAFSSAAPTAAPAGTAPSITIAAPTAAVAPLATVPTATTATTASPTVGPSSSAPPTVTVSTPAVASINALTTAVPVAAATPASGTAHPVVVAAPAPASTFATVTAATPSAPTTRSSTRRAQAAGATLVSVTPTTTPAPAPATITSTAPAAVPPPPVAPAAAPTVPVYVAHAVATTAPVLQPVAAPIAPANVAPAIAPAVPAAPVAAPPAAMIPHQGLVAPVAIPTGVAPGVNGAPAAVAGLQCTPPPPGGFHPVYGWNHKNIESNLTPRQATGWRNMQDDRVLIYEHNGSHHRATIPPGDFIERAKNALAQYFNCPAPLIGPAEAETTPALYDPPFLNMLSRFPLQHLQTLINQGCWSFPNVTFYVMSHPPEISPFLFTLDGLLYGPSQQDALDVANLVAAKIAGDAAAQAFLLRVHDNYPAAANPMQHFISTIRVSPMELSNSGGSVRTAWTVTAQPPTANVDEHNTWIATVSNVDFDTVMHYVGKAMSPPLFCNGCKSLGHPTGRCPTLGVPGIHVATPAAPAQPPANTVSTTAEETTRGRGGGRGRARAAKGGRGSQARRPARGRGF
ncbi:hypothetical protein B0H11DRAFT_2252114 [Mycena galericulata]|nr:hypothetical protein B0H11DRAFT_2252114 [Mycena galericulata]